MTTIVRRGGALALVVIALSGCAGQRLHREGMQAVDRGDFEQGIAKLEAAANAEPRNMTYRVDLKSSREGAVQRLLASADGKRAAGALDEATQEYRRVQILEPSNQRAARGLDGVVMDRRHADAVMKARQEMASKDYEQAATTLRAVLAEDPGYPAARRLTEQLNAERGSLPVAPRLRNADNRPVTLQFREANTKMVFEALSRQSGINFVFDKDVRADSKTTVFVQNVPIEQAIDIVLAQNQLGRQILSENMALIYPNTSAKQKEYQDQVVKTFYMTNASPKEAENLLKTVLNVKTIFVDERTRMMVVRDTPETMRMAEKLVDSLDLPEPEVMMEVEVLEITRGRLQQLGIKYPDSATVSATPIAGTNGMVLSDVGKQNADTLTITPLSVTLDLMKQRGVTNVLASPRIRARNKEKAKVLIGAREPVLTNSVTPTSSGAQVVTGSVQYLDVGLNLEVEPTIYLDRDVAIKVNLEVSSILKTVTNPVSGTIAYEIGTRNASTLLRLKDGETQILAGLIQDRDSHSASEVPGLGDIPILGRLFGSHRSEDEKTEIVLSITPRIVRSQPRPNSDVTEFWYGTESNTRSAPYSFANAGTARTAPTPISLAANATESSATSTEAPTPQAPVAAQRSPYLTAAQTRGGSAPAKVPDQQGAPVLSVEGPGETRVGDEFEVQVRMENSQSLSRLRAQVRFDASALQLVGSEPGSVMNGDGGQPKIETRAGGAQLELTGTAEAPVQGSGQLLSLRFKALAPRPNVIVAAQAVVIDAEGAPLAAAAPTPLSIAIVK